MLSLKKKFFQVFLLIYFIFGSSVSVNNGISFDEKYEQLNWNYNVSLIQSLSNKIIFDRKFDENIAKEYKRFLGYGIGFQIFSQPIQFFLKDLLVDKKNLDSEGALLISKHFVVFLFFFISGIFFYLILRKIIDNENFSRFGTIIYLTYPYLFGQAMFSPKDIPFMSIWVVCTYLIFNIFEKLLNNKNVNFKNIFIFSIFTSYLLSIRIAGILIFIQYIFMFLIYINLPAIKLSTFVKKYYLKILFFLTNLIFFTLLFYPIFWTNPLLIVDAINLMSSHWNNVGTTTYGKIMYATNLPSTYLPIWFSVKIPVIILIGVFLIPFCEKKIFINNQKSIFFGSILLTVLTIPLILILKKIHLYDELRQLMFLFPLIFILGLVSLYTFSKKFFYTLGVMTVCLFLIENIKNNPYQYVWFNLPSRAIDLTSKFELEYQGLSGREISKHIITLENKNICVLVNPIHSVKPFLKNAGFNCFDIWQKIDTNFPRPFLAVQHVRNLKKGKPYKCELLYETGFHLLFHKKKFVTGKLLRCN